MIKEFTLNPYPRKLWVVKEEKFEDIEDLFEFPLDGLEIPDMEEIAGITFVCTKDSYNGYMVFLPETATDSTLVHEAAHVTLSLYRDCGIELHEDIDQEPFCYLLEYIYKLLSGQDDL